MTTTILFISYLISICINAQDYSYIGCYIDGNPRALEYGPYAYIYIYIYGYTISECRAACDIYKYFAIQDGSWCSCGNSLDDAKKYGQAGSESECGKKGTGGEMRNSLYENTNVQSVDYIGCYIDGNPRALECGPQAYGYTISTCRDACINYPYYSVQHDSWCSCSNKYSFATRYGAAPEIDCGTKGTGGRMRNSVYKNNNVEAINIQYEYIGCYKD
eukprot:547005_1